MNPKLKNLHNWLNANYEDYTSLIAVGSIAVGDFFINGRSDHDFLLIFKKDPSKINASLEQYLKTAKFEETYLFNPLPRHIFLGPNNSNYAFSNKFRSKTIEGKNIIPEVKLPDKTTTKAIYTNGLEKISRKLSTRITNSPSWKLNKTRDEFWKLFKHSFMNLAIKAYAISGEYPKKRIDIVDFYSSKELEKTLYVLNSIDNQPKEEIVKTAKMLNTYLNNN